MTQLAATKGSKKAFEDQKDAEEDVETDNYAEEDGEEYGSAEEDDGPLEAEHAEDSEESDSD